MARKIRLSVEETAEIQAELRRIRSMSLPANKAKAFARLLWKLRAMPPFFALAIAEQQPTTWLENRLYHASVQQAPKLEASFRALRDKTYNRKKRWWREQNLPVEIKNAKTGKGFIAELTRLFASFNSKEHWEQLERNEEFWFRHNLNWNAEEVAARLAVEAEAKEAERIRCQKEADELNPPSDWEQTRRAFAADKESRKQARRKARKEAEQIKLGKLLKDKTA